MHETSKAVMRRIHDNRFTTRYFVGEGVDIGAGPDPIGQYREFFPGMRNCRAWDLQDGDAQFMASVADDTFDFVHSSHCLEHMVDPYVAFSNWLRVLKPRGHMAMIVPDEDLYEQGVFPSTFNSDHKWTFTIMKRSSWSPRSVNIMDMMQRFSDQVEVLKIERLGTPPSASRANRSHPDQTRTPVGESAIEVVLAKRS